MMMMSGGEKGDLISFVVRYKYVTRKELAYRTVSLVSIGHGCSLQYMDKWLRKIWRKIIFAGEDCDDIRLRA